MIKIGGADPNFQQRQVENNKQQEQVATQRSTAKAEVATSSPKTAETVAVSTVAREVGKVNAQIKNTPDVRREKVEAIKAKIASGDYHVSGDEIAGKVIENIVRQGK